MSKTTENIEALIKEMYDDMCNTIQSVNMIPMPYSAWLRGATLEDFLEFINAKYGKEEREETETWHSHKGNIEVPKGTFDKIYEDDEL